jgi:hypothetical protein
LQAGAGAAAASTTLPKAAKMIAATNDFIVNVVRLMIQYIG